MAYGAKGLKAQRTLIRCWRYAGNGIGTAYQFGGTTETDTAPPWIKLAARPTIVNGVLSVTALPEMGSPTLIEP